MKAYINTDHSSVMDQADDKLKAACERALAEKYGDEIPRQIVERYASELSDVLSHGFASY